MSDDVSPEPQVEPLVLTTADGVTLQAEIAVPADVRATVVVGHPHPLYGGSMYANVVEALFRALSRAGAAVLRFNFRGANGSGGEHDGGHAEQGDVAAAVAELVGRWPDQPLILAGYSFGADVALAVDHPSIQAWFLVAPPLRILERQEQVALTDERPKVVVAAAHDQFRPPAELAVELADAPHTSVTVAEGADHFFAAGLPTVVATAAALLETTIDPQGRLAAGAGPGCGRGLGLLAPLQGVLPDQLDRHADGVARGQQVGGDRGRSSAWRPPGPRSYRDRGRWSPVGARRCVPPSTPDPTTTSSPG